MIGRLFGKVIDVIQPGRLILDVNGVGYDVETSLNTFFQIEQKKDHLSLYIQTIVREDALLLYGFADKQEQSLFQSLIKVNGVGPKSAIAILSSTTPDDFIRAIHQNDLDMLKKLPGIGKKTAERLLIEMRDALEHLSADFENQGHLALKSSKAVVKDEAISALETLGYRHHDAKKVIEQLDDGEMTSEMLIRQALKRMPTKAG